MSLSLKNITKSFDEKRLFDNFSYNFEEKGIYYLVGESGSGKTTLLRIIAGLDKNYSGEVDGGGIGNVSYCFQEYRLFPHLSAIDNIVAALCDEPNCELRKLAEELLLKLKFSKNDFSLKPSELSGGMKQRVSFARAVLKSTPILLLDEFTKEVDPELSEIMHDIVLSESKTRLVLIVSHKESEYSKANVNIINLTPNSAFE